LAGAQHPGATYKGKPVLQPQGVSLLPLFYGQAKAVHAADEIHGWELFGYRSVRQGDWKLVWDAALPPAQRKWELFNVATDFEEQRDLANSNPQELSKMRSAWDSYEKRNGVIF